MLKLVVKAPGSNLWVDRMKVSLGTLQPANEMLVVAWIAAEGASE